jgi:hypothetical protein
MIRLSYSLPLFEAAGRQGGGGCQGIERFIESTSRGGNGDGREAAPMGRIV